MTKKLTINLPEESGVFAFVCNKNGQASIGFSTSSMRRSAVRQLSLLRAGKHFNRFMQEDYDNLGEEHFTVVLLDRVQPKDIGECKLKWINKWMSKYNIIYTNRNDSRTNEWRQKHRDINTGRTVNLTVVGRRMLVESVQGEKNPCAKLTEVDVGMIRQLIASGMSISAIARLFNVHRSSIHNIKVGRTWSHL